MPNQYLSLSKSGPLLKAEEERELMRLAGEGDGAAIERLIRSHARFVVKIARGYRQAGIPMSDLIQEGMVGLVHAIRKFDPDKDARLSTYAKWWIRAAMQDHVVRSWSLVRLGTSSAQKSLFLQVRRFATELLEGADALRDDMAARLADRFGTTATDVTNLARRVANRDHSLDGAVSSEAKETWLDQIPSNEPSAEERLVESGERRAVGDLIASALGRLPDREQFIIRRRYLEDAKETFASIGRELNLSKDRVRQLEARALASLRDMLGNSALERQR
ncbi:MAG: sigma-70 family RNA polymerase sigma factor [Proteobacteria bacterium]|nr:sigma-70 family RNA polymerase sigma factor [Pseudomonadota bacterium]